MHEIWCNYCWRKWRSNRVWLYSVPKYLNNTFLKALYISKYLRVQTAFIHWYEKTQWVLPYPLWLVRFQYTTKNKKQSTEILLCKRHKSTPDDNVKMHYVSLVLHERKKKVSNFSDHKSPLKTKISVSVNSPGKNHQVSMKKFLDCFPFIDYIFTSLTVAC